MSVRALMVGAGECSARRLARVREGLEDSEGFVESISNMIRPIA